MPPEYTVDVAGRVQAFMDAYGPAGVALLAVAVIVCVIYQLLRGPGLSVLFLLVSYSLVFVQVSGVSTAAFFVRTLALGLLVLSAFRRFTVPGWAFFGMAAYVLLGFAFAARAPNVTWSVQNAALLLVTTLALTVGIAQYLKSYREVRVLFHMFVVAGAVWTVASLAFVVDFLAGRELRFAGGGAELRATNYAASGALLLPFMLWAAIHRGRLFWRFLGIFGVLVMPICLFLSGTRTAIVVAVLAGAPLLLRGGLSRTVRAWVLVGGLAFVLLFAGRYLLRDRSTEFLVSRLTSTSLSGREVRWEKALEICMENPLIGQGIGANATLANEVGIGAFHSAYLSIWCNTGLLGLGLVLSVLVGYAFRALALIRRATNPLAKDAMRLAFGFLIALLALGIVENSFASPSNARIATLLIMATLIHQVGRFTAREEAGEFALQVSSSERGDAGVTPQRSPALASYPSTN